MKRFLASLFLVFTVTLAACGTEPARQNASNVVTPPKFTVGVLVSPDDATVTKTLVVKDLDALTAYVALKDTSVEMETLTSSFGTAICSIGGVGRPADNCFGSVTDPTWAFFVRNSDGTWSYSLAAADNFQLHDGDIVAFIYTTAHPDGTFDPYGFPNYVTDRTPPPVELAEFTLGN